MIQALDRPVLEALRTRQSCHAVVNGQAFRYLDDISPFAATIDDGDDSLSDLALLIPNNQSVVLLQAGEVRLPTGTVAEITAMGVQMIADSLAAPRAYVKVIDLTDEDAPEMQDLAALTKPGPFLSRTHHLGQFVGIRESGRLVAMAGERMKLPGFTEVSGVCTHPEYRGRGFASTLIAIVAERITERGETPFLHAYTNNKAAITVYQSLGFVIRSAMTVVMLRKSEVTD